MSFTTLFFANLLFNVALGAVIVWLFRGKAASERSESNGPCPERAERAEEPERVEEPHAFRRCSRYSQWRSSPSASV